LALGEEIKPSGLTGDSLAPESKVGQVCQYQPALAAQIANFRFPIADCIAAREWILHREAMQLTIGCWQSRLPISNQQSAIGNRQCLTGLSFRQQLLFSVA